MKLILAEPFKSLWAGRDAFTEVERLEGEVYRELDGRRTLRTEVEGRGYFVKIHRGMAGVRCSKTCSRPSCQCWARARNGGQSSVFTKSAYPP